MKLTVIIRDDSPLIFCGDSPSYRTVVIELTADQKKAIELRKTGVSCGNEIYESYSSTILEND